MIRRVFVLSALAAALAAPAVARAEAPIVAEKTFALRTAMSGATIFGYTVTQKDGVTIKAYVTHPDKLYLMATGANNAKFEISMSSKGTAILRDGKQLPDVPPLLQAVADYLRTQWDTVTVTREVADVDSTTGLVEVPFSGRMTPDLKKLVPAQPVHCTYEKLTNQIKHCERADLAIDFFNYQTFAAPTPAPTIGPTAVPTTAPTPPPPVSTPLAVVPDSPSESTSLQASIVRAMSAATAFHLESVASSGKMTADYTASSGGVVTVVRPTGEQQTLANGTDAFAAFTRSYREPRVLTALPDQMQNGTTYGAFATTIRSADLPEPVRVQCLYDRASYRLVGCLSPTLTIRYSGYAPGPAS